jgi:hypothetical protein
MASPPTQPSWKEKPEAVPEAKPETKLESAPEITPDSGTPDQGKTE